MATENRKRISLDNVKKLKPGGVIWDIDVTGFTVRCQRRAKVYGLKYRYGGKQRWYSIGRHGAPWTPEMARKEARRLLGLVASGVDPAAAKVKERTSPTLREISVRFMSEHVEAKRKPATAVSYRNILDRVILPELGSVRVRDVSLADLSRLHHKWRRAPYLANRAIAVLSKMLTLAEAWGERPNGSNPAPHIERFGERKRERLLSADELARLGAALSDAERRRTEGDRILAQIDQARSAISAALLQNDSLAEKMVRDQLRSLRKDHNKLGELSSLESIAAIRLLLFTGARLSEILGLEWDWVDFERGEARLPDSKTGAKTVQLPAPALEVLASLPRLDGNPYVISGRRTGAHLVNLGKPWRRIRKAAGLDDLRIHDLRHAFAGIAASSGMGLPIIGKMLGHAQPQTTARYAHVAPDPVKQAAATVAGTIAAAMRGEADEVVVISGRSKRQSG
jgi:integrase